MLTEGFCISLVGKQPLFWMGLKLTLLWIAVNPIPRIPGFSSRESWNKLTKMIGWTFPFIGPNWSRLEQLQRIGARETGVSRHNKGPIESLSSTPQYDIVLAIILGVSGGVFNHDYLRTLLSRTATRLIAVVFPVLGL